MTPLEQIAHVARENGAHRHGTDALSLILVLATEGDGEGVTIPEIAEACKVPAGTVYGWCAREKWEPKGEASNPLGRPATLYSRAEVALSLARRGKSL